MFMKHQNKRQYCKSQKMSMKHKNERQYCEPLKHVYEASERETILGTTKTCLSSIREPLRHVYEASEQETILGITKTCL